MLTVSKASERRIDLELAGSLDAEDMRRGLDDLIALSDGIEDGQMLYTVTDFAMPSAGAIAVEFGRLPQLFRMIGRFKRCAVLSDQGWLRTAAEIEGALIPGLAIRAFEINERDDAEVWLAGEAPED